MKIEQKQNMYLKSMDYKCGWSQKFKVLSAEEVNFGDEQGLRIKLNLEDSTGLKIGFILKRFNAKYLVDNGFTDTDNLIGHEIVLEKVEREFKSRLHGIERLTGIFIKNIN